MIRRQVVMPVTPERLWAALTDPEQMIGWFGARVEWQLEPGSPARFHGDDGHDRAGRVEVVRPGRHLRFRWWPNPQGGATVAPDVADGGEEAEVTEVSYVLEPVPGGTRLTVQEQQVDVWATGPDRPQARVQARAGGSRSGWTEWDGRLVTAWAGLAAPALEGVRA
jgi:uncharacterized protein YndB with AHSA1/START domain